MSIIGGVTNCTSQVTVTQYIDHKINCSEYCLNRLKVTIQILINPKVTGLFLSSHKKAFQS